MKHKLSFLLFIIISFYGISQVAKTDKYYAGFKTISLIDSSRIYMQNSIETDPLHYRPIDLDIWYPSREKQGKKLLFEDLFGLHEERANKYQNETDYTGFSEELVLYLAAGFGVEATEGKRLLKVHTNSYKHNTLANGPFPMVIYMAGYNGMGWENYRLLESLAENGFVVVSISSIGRYPGDMTNDILDTMEQVYDAEFALQTLKRNDKLNVDFEKVGLLGLSWGGMSSIIMLDEHPEFGAMVSLDGTDIFYYGDSDQDDEFLSEIYDADILHPEKVSTPYLHIEAGDRLDEFTPTGEYHYFKKINSTKNYLRFTDAKHEDFGSIAWALKTSEGKIELSEQIMETTVLFFKEHLYNQHKFKNYYDQLLQHNKITNKPYEYSTEKPKSVILSGIIRDSKNKTGLSYVNIGIANKELGTVSNKKGLFEFQILESNFNDTLRISRIGYNQETLLIKNLLNLKGEIQVDMKEEISELNEIVIRAKTWKTKTLGNKTQSTFIGHLFYYQQLGKEMGIRINVGKRPLFVNSFNFHVSHNRFSAKSFFRLNIYKLVNGKPVGNILPENIIIPVQTKQTGMISTDLRKYDIVLREDVIVTLEWVDNEGEIKPTEALAISVGLMTNGTYERRSKQARMKKTLKGMGLGFTLDVKY